MPKGAPPGSRRAGLSENALLSPHASLPQLFAAFKRNDEFWFEDGNLILVANQDTVFRIYRALLTAQSPVFAHSVASADAPNHMCDGCPVVEISETPEELAHFLRVVLPKSQQVYTTQSLHIAPSGARAAHLFSISITRFYRRKEDPKFTFDQVSSVVRLAHKYNLPGIRDQALELIEEHAFGPARGPYRPLIRRDRDRDRVLAFEPAHAIATANLTRLVDRPALRVAALYRCTSLGDAALRGWARDDGVVERLDPADLRLCMDADPALVRARVALCARVFDDAPDEVCSTREQCEAGLRKLADVIVGDGFWPEHCAQAGGLLDEWGMDLAREASGCGVCDECGCMVGRRDRSGRREAWRRMPEMFDVEVEGWETSIE